MAGDIGASAHHYTFWLTLTQAVLIVGLKALLFWFGYLTIRMGHSLLREGIKGEFKFSADISGAKADLASASPGLLFVVLGVALMGYAISVNKPLSADFGYVAQQPRSIKTDEATRVPHPDVPAPP